jgi:hypothetical protein
MLVRDSLTPPTNPHFLMIIIKVPTCAYIYFSICARERERDVPTLHYEEREKRKMSSKTAAAARDPF